MIWLLALIPFIIPGIVFVKRLGRPQGSMAALIPWIASVIAYQAGTGSAWSGIPGEIAAGQLRIVSMYLNMGCIVGILMSRKTRSRIVLCRDDLRRMLVWLFIMLYIVSIVWAPPSGAVGSMSGIVSLVSFGIVGSVVSTADIRKAFHLTIVVAFITLVLALFYEGVYIPGLPIALTTQYSNIFDVDGYISSRRWGLLPSVVTDGAIIGVGILCAYISTYGKKSAVRRNKTTLVGLLVMTLHVFVVQARWILFVLIANISMSGMLNFIGHSKKLPRRILVGTIILALASVISYQIIEGLDYMSRGNFIQDSTRSDLYKIGWSQVLNGPFMGTGYGSSAMLLGNIGGIVDKTTGAVLGAHNTYVFFGLEIGIVGMVMWIFILSWTVYAWLRHVLKGNRYLAIDTINHYDLVTIGFVGIAYILGGMVHTLVYVPWLWYMLMLDYRWIAIDPQKAHA